MKILRQAVIIVLTGVLALALFQRAYQLHKYNNELEQLVNDANAAFPAHDWYAEQHFKQEPLRFETHDCGNRHIPDNTPSDVGYNAGMFANTIFATASLSDPGFGSQGLAI